MGFILKCQDVGLPLFALLILACHARGNESLRPVLPFETVAPIVAVHDSRCIQAISIAGEPATGLVVIGSGLLGGTEPIRNPDGGTAITLLARTDDDRWRTIQTTAVSGSVYYSAVLDIDGDGLEDLIVASTIGRAGESLACASQSPEGQFLPTHEVDLPDSLVVHHVSRAGTDGRLMVLGRTPLADCVQAIELEWDPAMGLHILWRRAYSKPDLQPLRLLSWLPWGESGVALIGEYPWDESPRYYSLRLDDGTWMDAPLPTALASDGLFVAERLDGVKRWMWARADSLHRLDVDATGRIFPQAIPIQGCPTGWRIKYLGIPSPAVAVGEPPMIAMAGSLNQGTESVIGFVELTDRDGARWIDIWEHAPAAPHQADLAGLLERADGSLATLHDASGAMCEVRGPGHLDPADVPYGLLGRVNADLTGDGILDFFGFALTPKTLSPRFLRGIPEPPWFLPPVPVPVDPNLTGCKAADIDGDGVSDLVCLVPQDSAAVVQIYSFDGETLLPWSEDPVPVGPGGVIVADLDGNGRCEVLTEDKWSNREHHLLSWNADRAFTSSTVMNGLIFNALGRGDFDGDGREEILGWHYADFEVLQCNVDAERIDTLWRIRSGLTSLYDAIVGNIDADPPVELVWSDDKTTQVWSSDGPGQRPHAQVIQGLLQNWEGSYLSITDWNADGVRELVSYGDGVFTTVWNPLDPGATREEVRVLPDLLSGAHQQSLVVSDVDGDGDPDLIIFREDGIRVELNPTLRGARADSRSVQLRFTGPNPSQDRISAVFRILSGGTLARTELIDVAGRRVWEAERFVSPNAWIPVGIPDDQIRRLAAGVYWLRVRHDHAESRQKIVVIR